jgi:hypothetical protein
MAKPDSNFMYYVTKKGEGIIVDMCQGEICAMLLTKVSSNYAKAHTCMKKAAS